MYKTWKYYIFTKIRERTANIHSGQHNEIFSFYTFIHNGNINRQFLGNFMQIEINFFLDLWKIHSLFSFENRNNYFFFRKKGITVTKQDLREAKSGNLMKLMT